jgi:anaerobic sulfite reductase subunit B
MSTVTATAEMSAVLPARYRVLERREEIAEVVTLAIAPVDIRLADSEPGQFHMLWVFGIGEVPISIAGWKDDGSVEHTIRSVGAVTAALCACGPGTMIGVRGPFGHGFDLAAAEGRDLLVVGGGIGLAPLRSVVLAAIRRRARFGRIAVLVGARSPEAVMYGHEFDSWRKAGIEVFVTVDSAGQGWNGQVGVVTKLIGAATIDPAHTAAVVCGPEVMMRFVAYELLSRGVSGDAIQVSLERNMHCALGQCGRCQLGPHFVCHDGPVFTWPRVVDLLTVRER